ncbi:ABC transporter substrate-binding protein [Virgibacillus sp. MG-45]|uniref:ABC transporter substrate-binding protein n=1 Tax=Virgibacillus sp. MG-45 TaxID=3102791 RepID=UPI002ED9325E
MEKTTDHLGRSLAYRYPPKRIISLCPAITDTMYYLQLDDEIIGRTRFCIHPKSKVKKIPPVGGTKDLKIERIHALQPDLIIAEKEENTKEMVEQLEKDYPVHVFEVNNYESALRMITDLGALTNRDNEAAKLLQRIQIQFDSIPQIMNKRVAYVIWKKPYMVVGKNTYIHSLLEKMGFINPFTSYEGRYPVITEKDFEQAALDYIFLSTEPFPFQDKHKSEFASMLPNTKPMIVAGEMFWYGAKMLEAAPYFQKHLSTMQSS